MPDIRTSFSSGLYYQKTGAGPAIVLLHGFPESGTLWKGIQNELSERFTLIIPDLPGAGNSTLDQPASLRQMAEGLLMILNKEGINKAIIAGHSMGGYVALEFAGQYSSFVAGLSLIHSTPLPDDEDKKNTRRKAIEIVRNGGGETFLKQLVPGLFSPYFKQTQPALVEEQVSNALKMSSGSIINFYSAMMERSGTVPVLQAAQFPVQWILGADDTIIPADKVLKYCSVATVNSVSLYEQCGHMSMVEAPEKLIQDISAFGALCYDL